MYDNFGEGKRDYVALFQASYVSREDVSSWEVEGVEFFPLNGLPANLSPATHQRLEERAKGQFPSFGRW